jgi:pterin-4a-carbinolamine dehydratase
MPNSIFISYRRVDSQHATFAIADRLRWAFGGNEVFFDRGSNRSGNEWPASLRRGLAGARVLIVVIGEMWLKTADQWGRRRIDDPADWVRLEIAAALEANLAAGTAIIPVLLSRAERLKAEALDGPLQRFADFEPKLLDDDHWEDGLEGLIVAIAETTGLPRINAPGDRNPNGSPARPPRIQNRQRVMSDAEVRQALEPLGGWQLQWGPHPWGIGGQAQEISKSFAFESFPDAIAFMADASREIEAWKPTHHPRWENQWKVLNVFFTTWDVDCRVTRLDISAARKFDAVFHNWKSPSPVAGSGNRGDSDV